MKRLLYALMAVLATVTCGCGGHSDKFVIKGSIEGKPSTNIRVIYFTDGNIVTGITVANEGSFAFDGSSPDDALIEIYDNEYRLLGRTVARNGDDIELHLNPADPSAIKAKGNETAARWAAFMNENARSKNRHDAVKAYVTAHRDDPLSALLVMTEIDASGPSASLADSLLSLIAPEARATGVTAGFNALVDRVSSTTSHAPVAAINYIAPGGRQRLFKPSNARLNLIAVTGHYKGRDSVVKVLRDIPASNGLEVIELSADPDTIVWSRDVRLDSARWTHGWVAGSISGVALQRLGIPVIPYFIVTDSAGTQLWRGRSANEAARFIKNSKD